MHIFLQKGSPDFHLKGGGLLPSSGKGPEAALTEHKGWGSSPLFVEKRPEAALTEHKG